MESGEKIGEDGVGVERGEEREEVLDKVLRLDGERAWFGVAAED